MKKVLKVSAIVLGVIVFVCAILFGVCAFVLRDDSDIFDFNDLDEEDDEYYLD